MNKTAVTQFAVLNREMDTGRFHTVKREAKKSGFYALANLNRKEYLQVRNNLDKLCKKFGITQDDIERTGF